MKARKRVWIAAFVLLTAAALIALSHDGAPRITPADAHALLHSDSTVILLDVRTPAEFKSDTGHLAHALLIPLQELEQRSAELAGFKQRTIVVYCRTGHRSTAASEILSSLGYKVLNMEGGITRWRAEGLPTVLEPR